MARLPNGMTMTITGRTADALTVTINADEWVRAHLVAGGTLDDALAPAFPPPPSPDAMRLDAEADAELAEWRALLDAAKGRRRG